MILGQMINQQIETKEENEKFKEENERVLNEIEEQRKEFERQKDINKKLELMPNCLKKSTE